MVYIQYQTVDKNKNLHASTALIEYKFLFVSIKVCNTENKLF